MTSIQDEIWGDVISAYFPDQRPEIPGGSATAFFDGTRFGFAPAEDYNLMLHSRLEEAISAPSPMCRAYLDSIDRGEVDHYIGVSFGDAGSGVRAARASVRPCMDLRGKL